MGTLHPLIPKEYAVTIKEKTTLYPSTIHLKVTSETPIPFRPGQYASFLMGNFRRPFSFASLPTEEHMEFIIGYGEPGVTKPFIEPLKVGDSFKLLAPYGQFVLDEQDTRPLLFIAGGTGIAPIHGHLRQAFKQRLPQPIVLYFASYDEQRLYYRQEFEAFAHTHANFSFRPVLSQPDTTWLGKKGLVTTTIPLAIPTLPDYTCYVCGSPGFVMAVLTMLQENNMPKEHIHSERFT